MPWIYFTFGMLIIGFIAMLTGDMDNARYSNIIALIGYAIHTIKGE